MKIHFISIIIFLFNLLITGCSDLSIDNVSEGTLTIESPGIIPLKIGNTWQYKIYEYANDTSYFNREYEISISENNLLILNGEETNTFNFNFMHALRNEIRPVDWYYSNSNEGLRFYGGKTSSETYKCNWLRLKYPCTINDSWDFLFLYGYSDGSIGEISNQIITCIDTNRSFITPLQTFECFVYSYNDEEDHGDYKMRYEINEFYKPFVGLIGINIYYFDTSTDEKFLLYQYRLNYTNVSY